jgi:hypothetical protein
MKVPRAEIASAVILLISLVLLLDPFGFWMPNMLSMVLVAVVFVCFSIFISFVWKERPQDEREELHRTKAGRAAFLTGSIILALGVVVQSIAHVLDPWLVLALAGMIFAKIFGLLKISKSN